jgi:uncharacterized damage-inducible protein DinB
MKNEQQEALWKRRPLQAALAYAKLKHLPNGRSASRSYQSMRKTSDPLPPLPLPSAFAVQLPGALLNAFNTNNRINQYLIDNVPLLAWRADPPGGKGRTIPAVVAHMHNVRVMWLKAAAKEGKIPAQLNRDKVTPTQALRAMEQSRQALSIVISHALESDGRVKGFRPDVAGFLGYLIAHDAHHRGQIAMLARQVGHPLPQKITFGMWEWGSR